MRRWLGLCCLLATGCQPGVRFNNSETMAPQEMLSRADLVFVGVVQSHNWSRWPLLIPGDGTRFSNQWRKLSRSVRVELVLQGKPPGDVIDVGEIAKQVPTTSDWNNTHDGRRALFLVRKEGDQYHVVRDGGAASSPSPQAGIRNFR